jgi:FkbM family methyltransferase
MIRQLINCLPYHVRFGAFQQLKAAFPGRFRAKHAADSFSQCGEDRILAFLFDHVGVSRPRYLDVGTCHPCEANNTYLFYRTGGTGVCVEPNPDLAPLIRRERPNDTVLNVGVSPNGVGVCRYYLFANPALNTFDAEEAAARVATGANPLIRELSVPVVDLESIFMKYFPDGIDLLSLDAEGLDLALLQSVDFETHRPLALCVETVGFSESLAKPKCNGIAALLATHEYAVFADTFVNTIFVDLKRVGSFAL